MNVQSMLIREATDDDFDAVMDIECRAFGSHKEAQLVCDLLGDPTAKPRLSLLATDRTGRDVGHILFTRVSIIGAKRPVIASLLAPLAAAPEAQAKGVGAAMITGGLQRLRSQGDTLVFVLGHPGYYPRFGFRGGAGPMGFEAPYPIPKEHEDAWMVQTLREEICSDFRGKIRVADALMKPQHWRE